MKQVEPNTGARNRAHKRIWTAALAAIAGAVAIGLSAAPAYADPVPPPGEPTPAPAPAPAPADPNAPAPAPADPNAPPAVVDPAMPELGRVDDSAGGFSYVLPAGWVQSDTSHLDYGSSLLSKQTGEAMLPGQPPPVANDTRIVLGKLDQRLYASGEADNAKAATRLGSDMGEFYLPYPGTRANQETIPLTGNGLTGSAAYYEVKFSDPAKPVGQIWSGVIGLPPANASAGAAAAQSQRWFVVWLGTANNPVDKGAAKALAESILPLAPPPPAIGPVPALPGVPSPEAPAPVLPGAPAVPAEPAPAEGPAPAVPGAPAAPAPAAPPGAPVVPAPAIAPVAPVAPAPAAA